MEYESNAEELHHFIQRERLLLDSLHDGARGGKVVILGSGPSLVSADFYTKPGRDPVIAMNSAVDFCPDADIWLTCESRAWDAPWFSGHGDFRGTVIMEASMPQYMIDGNGGQVGTVDPYVICQEAWWKKAIYVERALWSWWNPKDIRRGGPHVSPTQPTYNALSMGETATGDPSGTVLWQAIHLAGILGASECHLYGCELCWPYNRNQHVDGWCPYDDELAERAPEVGLVRFDDVSYEDYDEPVRGFYPSPSGVMETQRMFLESARILTGFMAECCTQGMRVYNHSGGLLDLELGE